MINYRLAAVAVFCLVLGFVVGTGFRSSGPDEQALAELYSARLQNIRESLQTAMALSGSKNYEEAYRHVSKACTDCFFLQRDIIDPAAYSHVTP